jgi:hypothetical protein
LLTPAPQRPGVNPERGSHVTDRGGFDRHQLDRGQPPQRDVPDRPGVDQLAAQEYPATLNILHERYGLTDAHSTGLKGHRKGRLGGHHSHHAHPPVRFQSRNNYSSGLAAN